jgi:hypothetical protein
MPIIQATGEVEIGKIKIQDQPREIVQRPLSPK